MFHEIEYLMFISSNQNGSPYGNPMRNLIQQKNVSLSYPLSLYLLRELFAFPLNLLCCVYNVQCVVDMHVIKCQCQYLMFTFFPSIKIAIIIIIIMTKKSFTRVLNQRIAIKHFCCDDKLRFIMVKTYMFSFLMLTNIFSASLTLNLVLGLVGPTPAPASINGKTTICLRC